MDTRTIERIDVVDGATVLHLSDESTAQFGSFIASSENGGCVLVELRAADGSLTGDGPVLTDEIRAQFTALGVENIPVPVPAAIIATDTPTTGMLANESTPAPVSPALVLSPEEHAASKSLADEIEAHIPEAVKEAWAKLRALLHHL